MQLLSSCMKYYTMAVVVDQHHEFKPFGKSQRCRLPSYTHLDSSNCEFDQNDLVNSLREAFEFATIQRSFSTPCLSSVEEEFDNKKPRIKFVFGGHGSAKLHSVVVEAAMALASGVDPVPVSSGLGGTYILRSRSGGNIAVAKPIDEEPLACNNPKGFGGRMMGQPGLKRSVRIGETGIRELAAYLLDYGGFAGVPPTALVEISHVGFHVNNNNHNNNNNSSSGISAPPCKIASFQSFVDHDFDAGELGPSSFSVSAVHRVGIFDVRLLNLDRHAGNILVKKKRHGDCEVGGVDLVPIDHGLCLPEWLDDPYFEWLHWPQASVPFSEAEIEYIANLDPFKDAELLRTELPALREASIRILILCTIFLKKAAAFGLCLADIGEMMTREFCTGEENSSALENICARAMAKTPFIPGEHGTEQSNGDMEMFVFENETKDGPKEMVLDSQLLETPPILMPSKFPHKLRDTETSPPSFDQKNDINGTFPKITHNGSCLIKSKSFSEQNLHSEGEVISFGDMLEEEWEIFLDNFDKLLPEVFEETSRLSSKLRMGSSCKF